MMLNVHRPKKWNIADGGQLCSNEIQRLACELSILPVTALILYNRGFTTVESARSFLFKDDMYFFDPFLLLDMEKAVDRIAQAVEKKRNDKIIIYGDYDVDGVTSVSVLYLYLKEKNPALDIEYYIPSRTGEGYGLSCTAIRQFAENGVTLVITVDTGITACEEARYAKELGIDMIITDHHECHCSLPNAVAVVNPHRPDCRYPFTELAGVGVVFKLVCALEKTLCGENTSYLRKICDGYCDLVAIGTVADVMPLISENRLIVSIGLKIIENTGRPGLSALLESAGGEPAKAAGSKKRRITSSLIGYVIAPRINAAGRITSASKAVDLFLTSSLAQANALALELCETNRRRQEQENEIAQQAYEMIAREHDFEHDSVIVLADDHWNHGVIGIVASRITERYNLPCILISFDGDIGKGSGRSIKGLNLSKALAACGDYLLKHGGHELAAGLSIEREKYGAFKKAINQYILENLSEEALLTSITIDCELSEADLNLKLASELQYLEPYGVANPVPLFILKDAEILEINGIGNSRHTKFLLKKGNSTVSAVCFGMAPSMFDLYPGDMADVVFNLDINDFQNNRTLQLLIRDIALCEKQRSEIASYKKLYADIRIGRKIFPCEDIVPSREDFAGVYLYLKNQLKYASERISLRAIEKNVTNIHLNYTKIKFILDIFQETNIISIENISEDNDSGHETYGIKINQLNAKVNIEKSNIYKRLKCRQERS